VHYLIVAGTHASKRSAIDEARSFELLDIQAKVQHFGGKYHVVLGRYSSRKDADKARDKLGQSGRGVRIVVDRNSW
jgi:cell division protein FtsN